MQRKTILRWGALAIIVLMLAQIVLLTSPSARAAAPDTMYVSGRFLYDKFGVKFIPYGINHMTYWTDLNGALSCPEIAKTGANIIRLQWLTTGTADQLDTAITNCRASKMVVMPELHDATGDWAKLPTLVDYWVRPDIVAVIQKHQEYVLVNIGNEVGQTVTDADFIAGYTTAVTRMRTAGIHVPLVIDASSYGQNINGLQANGPTLIANDPEHNLMFSVHMWWPYMWGHTDQEVIDEIAQSVAMNLPLVIGEFGNQWDATAAGQIPYKLIIEQAHLNEVGYLPWSWGPGNNPQTFLDMTTDQTYATLNGWGLEVAVTDTHSIKNIAVRPAWLNTAPPTAVPTAVPANLVSFNKPVTASSVTGTNTANKAVDGNGGTRWESAIADPQSIQIDLGSITAISNVDIVWEGAFATQYKLQISNDATTWTDAYTEWSGTGGTKTIPVNLSARYVRMYGTQRTNSAWGYSIWEFRVWSAGTAAPTFTPTKTYTAGPPTNTPTITRTSTTGPTPTNTPITPTSTPVTPTAGGLKVQMVSAGTDNTQQTAFNLKVMNTTSSAATNITSRIYFTLDGSNPASSYVLEKYYDQSGVATVSGPTLLSGSTYYFTINFGTASLPAGGAWAYNTGMHLSSWASTYNGTNDFWHGTGTLPAAFTDWSTVPAYVSGTLVWGAEPGGNPITSTPTRTVTPTGVVSGPDLRVVSATFVASPPACSNSYRNDVVVQNSGTVAAGSFVVAYGTQTQTVSGLAAGQSVTLSFSAVSGSITATADSTNVIAETNETNNTLVTSMVSPTQAPTCTPTSGPSFTPTRTPTATPTCPCFTNTPTRTPTVTITVTPLPYTPTPSRTPTATITPTQGSGTCTPTSTVTAPFTFDGAGTYCWQISTIPGFVNSWNATSISINGMTATNIYISAGSLPAKIGGYYYINYNSAVAWGHFEAK